MVSFAYPDCMPIIADACQSFAMDNGAFSAWKSEVAFDIQGYRDWVKDWHKHPGFGIQNGNSPIWAIAAELVDDDPLGDFFVGHVAASQYSVVKSYLITQKALQTARFELA